MIAQQINADTKSSNGFNSKKLISRVLDYWYLYVVSLIICLAAAWYRVHYATPMYKVSAKMIVQDDKDNGSALSGSGGGMDFSSLFDGKTNMANEIAILQTSDLCRQVVNKLQLYITYYHKGNIREVELYKSSPFQLVYLPDDSIISPVTMELKFQHEGKDQAFTISAGGQTMKWHFYDTLHFHGGKFYFIPVGKNFDADASYILSIANPQSVADGIVNNLTANLLTARGTILSLTYNTNVPKKGEDVLQEVINAYISRSLDEKNRISDSTIRFISSRILLVGSELGNIENTIQNFKQTNKIANLSTQSGLLISNSSQYNQKLNDLAVQLEVIKTMLAYLQNDQNNRRPVPALLNSDGTFSGLVNQYNAAQVQRDKLLLSVKESNPLTTNLDSQIAGIRGDMIRSLQSQQEILKISQQQLNVQNNEVTGLIHNVPEQERKFLDYSREQDIKQALYLFLLQKKEETSISKSSTIANASVLEAPRANYLPYEPNKSTALTIGFLLGLALPTGLIMLRFLLNNKITSKEDITEATPASILAEIGHSPKQGLIQIKEEGRSIIAEQFRIFRTNMDFALAGAAKPIIMITSSMSGEGKSFIASNLGQIYAISGKKVLLMELDLRKPKLSEMLNASNDNGFSNFIISDRPVQDFIKPVGDGSIPLFVLSSGPIPPNPAELLMSDKMAVLMGELRQQFDVIIMDTAPIGAVTDAQILGRFADTSLYVVRQNYSLKNSLAIVNDVTLYSKLPSVYLIVNDVKTGTSYKYGYGYGYRYGYGYGYTDTVKKDKTKKWWKRK